MLGAIFGDIVGSVYEFRNTNNYNFKLLSDESAPTDDSYMTLAVAKSLLENGGAGDEALKGALVKNMQEIGRNHPYAGYGGMFFRWLSSDDPEPYNSYGNGSAMRVSPTGWLYETLEETLRAAEISAVVTHNHPEGIKGAKVIAAAIFMARKGAGKDEIKGYIEENFEYDLSRTLDEIRPNYRFYEICQKSCPEAIIAFLEGENYEDVIRKAVSLGGDSDTIACMAGAIAEAYYGFPEEYREEVLKRLDPEMSEIVAEFERAVAMDNKELEAPFMRFNPLIEERIESYYKTQESKDAMKVFEAILLAMSQDGHVIVPAETPKALSEAVDPDNIRVGEAISFEEELHFKLISLTLDGGKTAMPVFTSSEMLSKVAGSCTTFSMFLDAYMGQVLGMKGVDGILINPGERSFFLNRELMELILRDHKKAKTEQHTPSSDAVLEVPQGLREGFTDVVTEFIRNNLADTVERVWFTGLFDKGEHSLLFAIDADEKDAQNIFDRLHTFMMLLKIDQTVDYVIMHKSPWEKAELIYERDDLAQSKEKHL